MGGGEGGWGRWTGMGDGEGGWERGRGWGVGKGTKKEDGERGEEGGAKGAGTSSSACPKEGTRCSSLLSHLISFEVVNRRH